MSQPPCNFSACWERILRHGECHPTRHVCRGATEPSCGGIPINSTTLVTWLTLDRIQRSRRWRAQNRHRALEPASCCGCRCLGAGNSHPLGIRHGSCAAPRKPQKSLLQQCGYGSRIPIWSEVCSRGGCPDRAGEIPAGDWGAMRTGLNNREGAHDFASFFHRLSG